MRGDGDGWVIGGDGSRYWGVNGAAGLLVRAPHEEEGRTLILLQHRAVWSHQGGTWGLPGGARDSHESAIDTALREAHEEAGIEADDLHVVAALVTHRVDAWTYTTVIADVDAPVRTVANGESAELRWVDEADVDSLPLHPAFGEAWPQLRERLAALDPT
ncbi:NUDIX hydrolase [Gordonia sp. VNQ95]|uniref:NUDIX hydrolase n=1 Tax=Gordonia TaxID=2053 RepID=UPI0032B53930